LPDATFDLIRKRKMVNEVRQGRNSLHSFMPRRGVSFLHSRPPWRNEAASLMKSAAPMKPLRDFCRGTLCHEREQARRPFPRLFRSEPPPSSYFPEFHIQALKPEATIMQKNEMRQP